MTLATFVAPVGYQRCVKRKSSLSVCICVAKSSPGPCTGKGSSLLPACSIDKSTKPDYKEIDGRLSSRIFQGAFARSLQQELPNAAGLSSSPSSSYEDVMKDVLRLAALHSGDVNALRAAAFRVLQRLMPEFITAPFAALISKPFPKIAGALCARVTVATTQWLMGRSIVKRDDSSVVEIERCRYLEEAGCVGICLNSCKVPTELFFEQHMGLPLHVDPNAEDFSCKFRFGTKPPDRGCDPAFSTPCFKTCELAKEVEVRRSRSDIH